MKMKIREFEFDRYNQRQVREYVRFMEFSFIHQMNYTGDPLKSAILRAIYLEEIDRDRGCNASSLSKSLGIPRETVRRKSQKLMERNWLVSEGTMYRLNSEMMADDRFFEKIGFPGIRATTEVPKILDRLLQVADRIRRLGN